VVPSRTPAAATRFGKRLLKTNLDHAQLAVVACLTVLASAPRSGSREQAAAVDRATVSPHRRCADLAKCETDVVYGAETCIRVGACTRSQRGRRECLCPI